MTGAQAWLEQLLAATNGHAPDAIAACFAHDYENQTPAHPARGFRGRDQVRRNWEQILAFVPDLRAEVRAVAFDGNNVWTEWEMRGTRRDGSVHLMTGVIVFEIAGEVAHKARFFLEPVDHSSDTVDDAVRTQVLR